MRKFEVGKSYRMRSACDHECVWEYEVIGRTEKTVTLLSDDCREIRRRVSVHGSGDGACEIVHPLGHYSMAPAIMA